MAVAVLGLLAAVVVLLDEDPSTGSIHVAAGSPLPRRPPPPAPPPPTPTAWEVADAAVPWVPLFEAPNVPVAGGRRLKHPTREKLPLVMLVKQNQGEWLRVQIPTRPNGATAWVRRSDVAVRTVPNHILVNLRARRLTVLHGDRALGTFSVAIGAPSGPTPTGSFFVDGMVRLRRTTGPYGVGQLSVAGFSNVYRSFGGGVGQIAIHGTNRPGLLGGSVSHGCVRMANADWMTLVELAPSGTPVNVVA